MAALNPAVPPAPTFQSGARGFSLTEMAVVLAIVALLIGSLVIPLSAQQDIRAEQETAKQLEEIREALIGFAVVNSRLPRPATSASNGAEAASACADDAACSGFIPWATLGVRKADSWNKLIRYSVTPAYANSSISLTTVANRTVQTRNSAGTAEYLAGAATCTTAAQCVPAVIFSHGKQRWGTDATGTVLLDGSATNSDEDANNSGPTNYFSRLPTSNTTIGGGEFDDVITWLPTTILVNRMIATGKLP